MLLSANWNQIELGISIILQVRGELRNIRFTFLYFNDWPTLRLPGACYEGKGGGGRMCGATVRICEMHPARARAWLQLFTGSIPVANPGFRLGRGVIQLQLGEQRKHKNTKNHTKCYFAHLLQLLQQVVEAD